MADHLAFVKVSVEVQRVDPKGILLELTDPYLEDLTSDINRTRLLKAKSVIAVSGGNTANTYRAVQDRKIVGQLDMHIVMRALVPRTATLNHPNKIENVPCSVSNIVQLTKKKFRFLRLYRPVSLDGKS
ncbi:MAG: hypothetical protein P8M25_07320 [Paracoccaceae bacterium]|nr:hypothetical protein [Paracoccaceae bacterium]